jgi:hypothetical protein
MKIPDVELWTLNLYREIECEAFPDSEPTNLHTAHYIAMRARGSVLVSGTMLQAGRSRVRLPTRSLEFSLILPAALGPWG